MRRDEHRAARGVLQQGAVGQRIVQKLCAARAVGEQRHHGATAVNWRLHGKQSCQRCVFRIFNAGLAGLAAERFGYGLFKILSRFVVKARDVCGQSAHVEHVLILQNIVAEL